MRQLKTIFILTVALAGMAVSFSCSDNDDNGTLLSVDQTNIRFTAEGGTASITVDTELTGWVAALYGVGFSKKSQNGNTIIIEANENTATRVRTGMLEITHEELSSAVYVNLSQDAAAEVPPATYILGSAETDSSMGLFSIEFVNKENSNEVIRLRGMSSSSTGGFSLSEGSYYVSSSSSNILFPGYATVNAESEIILSPSYHGKLNDGGMDIADCSFFTNGVMTVTKSGNSSYSLHMYFESIGLEYDESAGELNEITAPAPEIEATFTGAIVFAEL